MSSNESNSGVSVASLIFVPAVITLAITVLRLFGELQHWSRTFFNPTAGGGGAILGITWLAPLFGIYFAIKLVHAGEGPKSAGLGILWSLLALVPVVAGGYCFNRAQFQSPGLIALAFAFIAVAALVPAMGWRSLFKVLLAYAYAARVPVVILMFFAIQGNWGTHYDVTPPGFPADVGFWTKYLYIGFLPQMIMWIAFTTIMGTLFGSVAAIFASQRGRVAQTA
jgi:hypothetical protein